MPHTHTLARQLALLKEFLLAGALCGAAGLAACTDAPTSAPEPAAVPAALALVSGPSDVLVGAGNIARCNRNQDEATAKLLDQLAGTVFTTGNNVDASGSLSDFTKCYGPTWGRHKARTRPAVGDREYQTSGASGYFGYFGTAAGSAGQGYYSYDLGAWHVVVLNSEISTAAASTQVSWLKADLAASGKACTIGIWNEPRFSSSGTAALATVQPLWDALYAAGAEIVLNGHYRVYERFAPQTPTGTVDATYGLRQFTVGTGGDGTDRFGSTQANSQVRQTGVYGVLQLTLGASAYDWRFVPIAGESFTDTGSGTCHGSPTAAATTASVTVAPTTATLTTVGATQQITATAHDASGTAMSGQSFTWTTSTPGVATVNSTGLVTAVANGSTTITATTNGKSGTAAVAVSMSAPPPSGTVLFEEKFEDTGFASRGWYDLPSGGITSLSTTEHISGSAHSLQVHFLAGGTSGSPKTAARHLFTPSSSVYVRYWTKFSSNWVGSAQTYQPHEFHVLTTEDDQYTGLAATHLTTYIEHNYTSNGGVAVLETQDALNIDATRINQDLTNVTEKRGVSGCNGNPDGGSVSCYADAGTYYNGKAWQSAQPVYLPSSSAGAAYKGNWHEVEVYMQLNTIANGKGQLDGVAQYWVDGQLVIDRHNVVYRTATYPNMKFNQFVMAPYIGDGSPVDQSIWYDDLIVMTSRPGAPAPPPPPPPAATVASVTVAPAGATLSTSGAKQQFTATARDASGTAMSGQTFTWASTNGAVASVSTSGLVTAGASGAATITAATSGKSGTAGVSVTAPTGGFSTPNIVNNASFETGWDGAVNWSGDPPPTGVTRATDFAYDGQYSIKRSWTAGAGETGAQFVYSWASTDHLWLRFYFRLTQPVTSIMKFARFYANSGTNFGGLFLGSGSSIIGMGWDQENSSIVTGIGLTQAQVVDGNWHSIEIDYWRNGDPSGYPSVGFWFDGNPVSLPNGTGGVQYAGSGNKSYWQGGRLYAGERASSEKMNWMEWLATLNAGNTTTGQVNIDKIAISTVGRIGP